MSKADFSTAYTQGVTAQDEAESMVNDKRLLLNIGVYNMLISKGTMIFGESPKVLAMVRESINKGTIHNLSKVAPDDETGMVINDVTTADNFEQAASTYARMEFEVRILGEQAEEQMQKDQVKRKISVMINLTWRYSSADNTIVPNGPSQDDNLALGRLQRACGVSHPVAEYFGNTECAGECFHRPINKGSTDMVEDWRNFQQSIVED